MTTQYYRQLRSVVNPQFMLCNNISGLASRSENLARNPKVTRSFKDRRKPKESLIQIDVKEMCCQILNGFCWFYYPKCVQLLKKDSNLLN